MGGIGKLFGVLFFTCLVFAGITSSISLVEASSSAFIDKTGANRKKVVSLVCLVGYSISIIYTTGAGLYFLDIIDNFVNSYGIVSIGLLEAIAVGWFFGASKIREHTNPMSYFSVGKWWNVMVKFVTPAILTFMIISNVINEISKPYGGYSQKALLAFGWSAVIIGIGLSLIISQRPWKDRSITSYKSEEVK